MLRNTLNNEQHGFRSGRSNLAIYKQNILDSFSIKSQTDVIYDDFNKAFE